MPPRPTQTHTTNGPRTRKLQREGEHLHRQVTPLYLREARRRPPPLTRSTPTAIVGRPHNVDMDLTAAQHRQQCRPSTAQGALKQCHHVGCGPPPRCALDLARGRRPGPRPCDNHAGSPPSPRAACHGQVPRSGSTIRHTHPPEIARAQPPHNKHSPMSLSPASSERRCHPHLLSRCSSHASTAPPRSLAVPRQPPRIERRGGDSLRHQGFARWRQGRGTREGGWCSWRLGVRLHGLWSISLVNSYHYACTLVMKRW